MFFPVPAYLQNSGIKCAMLFTLCFKFRALVPAEKGHNLMAAKISVVSFLCILFAMSSMVMSVISFSFLFYVEKGCLHDCLVV